MLFLNCFTPWGPGALYAELYLGLCRALVAPWLPPVPAGRSAPAQPTAPSRTAPKASGAAPTAGATDASPSAPASGAQIISFDRARARLARREAG
jgi:hypothetical protein